MKKLVSVLLCLMLVLGCVSTAGAEAFDPTANIWYASCSFEEIEYETGEVRSDKFDYTLPMSGYTYFVLNPDGTGIYTVITSATPKEYNDPVTWTQPSQMQIQLDFEDGNTWLLEYADGSLKRTYQRQSSEYEDVAYTSYMTVLYTNDEDGAIRYAMQNYVGDPDDPWDPTATEEMLKRDMVLTAFYNESLRYVFDIVTYQSMDMDNGENDEKWVGSISWMGDTWEISLDTKDELYQHIGLSSSGYSYQNGYITFYVDATTPEGVSVENIPVSVAKYEGRECYCVRLGNADNHFDFQAVPAEVIDASYN